MTTTQDPKIKQIVFSDEQGLVHSQFWITKHNTLGMYSAEKELSPDDAQKLSEFIIFNYGIIKNEASS